MTTLTGDVADEITTTDRTIMKYVLSGTTDASDAEEEQEDELEEGQNAYKEVYVIIVYNNDKNTLAMVDDISVEIPEAILDRYSQQFVEIELLEPHSPVSWDNINYYPEFYDFNLRKMIDTPYPFIRINATKNSASIVVTNSKADTDTDGDDDDDDDPPVDRVKGEISTATGTPFLKPGIKRSKCPTQFSQNPKKLKK